MGSVYPVESARDGHHSRRDEPPGLRVRTPCVRTLTVTAARGLPPTGGGAARAHADLPDVELVALVREGDGRALEALYGRFGRSAYSLARRILVDPQLAQDVVQEVFLMLWKDASRFDASRGSFSSWLLSVVHHKAVDSVRREENLRKRRSTHGGARRRHLAAAGRRRGLDPAARRAGPVRAQGAAGGAARRARARLLRRLHPARDRRDHRHAPGHREDPDARRDAPDAPRPGVRRRRLAAASR